MLYVLQFWGIIRILPNYSVFGYRITWQYQLKSNQSINAQYMWESFHSLVVVIEIMDVCVLMMTMTYLLEDISKGNLAEHVVSGCGWIIRTEIILPQFLVVGLVNCDMSMA